MRVRFLIDPDGRRLSETIALSRWRRNAEFADARLLTYLVNQIGFVLCDYRGDRLRVTLNAQALSELAAASLLYLLADHRMAPGSLILLSDGAPVVHTFRSGPDAAAHIVELQQGAPRGRHGRFDRRPLSCDFDLPSEFRALLAAGDTLPQLRPVLRTSFEDRFLLLAADPESGYLRLVETGDGYPALGEDWRAIGRLFGDFDDIAYGLFVAEAYREAAWKSEPVIEVVTAMIDYPGSTMVQTTYSRLIMPVRQGRMQLFLSASRYRSRSIIPRLR